MGLKLTFCFWITIILTQYTIGYDIPSYEELFILENELIQLFQDNGNDWRTLELAGSAIRLVFHDCANSHEQNAIISICDGCIDLNDTNNHGNLAMRAVKPLENIYLNSNMSWYNKITRADYWAFAATVALILKKNNSPAAAPLDEIPYYFGRKDCSTSPNINTDSIITHKIFPKYTAAWNESHTFLQKNFNFTFKDSIAMLGLHGIGKTHLDDFGINLKWVGSSGRLVHRYFISLMDQHWKQTQTSTGTTYWIHNDWLRLNVDMSLLLDIDSKIIDNNGTVACINYTDCGYNENTYDIVELFAADNHEWLIAMRLAFMKMVTIGYNNDQLTTVWMSHFNLSNGSFTTTLAANVNNEIAVIIAIIVVALLIGIVFTVVIGLWTCYLRRKNNTVSRTKSTECQRMIDNDEETERTVLRATSGENKTTFVENALVLIIGIADYNLTSNCDTFLSEANFENLPIDKDIEHLMEVFKLLNYNILPKYCNNLKLNWTEKEIVEFLKTATDEIVDAQQQLKYDGLIVCISCHGIRDHIITSDIKALEKTVIHRIISVQQPKVRNIPRIFLFDCCDGSAQKQSSEKDLIALCEEKEKEKETNESNEMQKQLERKKPKEYSKYLGLENIENSKIWTTHQQNPDYKLVEIHAANAGFQAKMSRKSGSYLLSEFTQRLKTNIENENDLEPLGTMFEKIQNVLHERGKQQTRNIFYNDTRYVVLKRNNTHTDTDCDIIKND